MYCVLCTVYCVLCTVYCVLCTVYFVLCTVYCVLCTVYCVLCTVYCVLPLFMYCTFVYPGAEILMVPIFVGDGSTGEQKLEGRHREPKEERG